MSNLSEYRAALASGEGEPNALNTGRLFSILQHAAADSPETAALVQNGRSLPYKDFLSAAERLAGELAEAGLRAGDKAGIMAASSSAYLMVLFAVLRVGAIAVPVSRAAKFDEVVDLADQIRLDAFCFSQNLAPSIPEGRASAAGTPVWPDQEAISIRRFAGGEIVDAERERLSQLSVSMIRFSSGTTGAAKGVILSENAILARARTFSLAYAIGERCCVLHLLSPELATPTLLGCLMQRAKIVFEDIHKLESIARLIRVHRVTHIHASPLFYRMIVGSSAIDAMDLRSVTHVISTGAALPAPVAKAFHDRFGREILQYYALAECGTVFAGASQEIRKRGSSGTLVPGCDARLARSTLSDEGEIGDLMVRGSGLLEGYYRPWKLRDEVLENGWFNTGDVARRDPDGYYWIVGRTKDVINVGGVKVFPAEIEELLLSHPAVAEAAVFAAPDLKFGEVPLAKVTLVPGAACTEKELIEFSGRKLSVFKRPRSIAIVPELPKTPTGKLRRNP